MKAYLSAGWYLLLFSVELKALSEGAGLGLMMLLPVQIDALSIWNILLLSVAEQTAENRKRTIKMLKRD